MIKFVSRMEEGVLYGFGLTEANLNRLEFNGEPIIFSFDYADLPDIYGIFFFAPYARTPEEIAANPDLVTTYCESVLKENSIPATAVRAFPIATSIMAKFRETPYFGFPMNLPISNPQDQQLIFAGPDERAIERYLRESAGLTSLRRFTKRSAKEEKVLVERKPIELVYVAGPYRGNVEANIARARRAAIALWEAGFYALCPHLNTAHFEHDCFCTDEQYLKGDLVMLARCDAAVFLHNWEQSAGARDEFKFCLDNDILTFILSDPTDENAWTLPTGLMLRSPRYIEAANRIKSV